jgi:hypothetical protein
MKNQATLPQAYRESTISAMHVGQTVFTVPWAVWVDHDMLCWLHPGYSVDSGPGGTVQMQVTRKADGYHVWGVRGFSYSPQQTAHYVGADGTEFIPVAEFHLGRHA